MFLEETMLISSYTKSVLKNRYHFCNDQTLQELEQMCQNFLLERKKQYDLFIEENKKKKPSADTLIWRIQHYYSYATLKESPKMRFTKKEYDEGLSILDEEEQQKVEKWLDDNGGKDKFIFAGW
jgi:hypothetical protein